MTEARRHGGTEARRGFTLTELMVAVAVLIVVILATGKIFSTAGKITAVGQATADILQEAAAIERRLRADFARIDPEAPLMIRCVTVSNDVNVDDGGPLLDPSLPAEAQIRCDQVLFFTNGPETSKVLRAGAGAGGKGQANATRIYFGHGFQLPRAEPIIPGGDFVRAHDPVVNVANPITPWYFFGNNNGPLYPTVRTVFCDTLTNCTDYTTTQGPEVSAIQPPAPQWLLVRQPVMMVDDGGSETVFQFEWPDLSGYRSAYSILDPVVRNGRVDAAASELHDVRDYVTIDRRSGGHVPFPWIDNSDLDQREQMASLLFYPRVERIAPSDPDAGAPSAHRVDQALTNHVLAVGCSSVRIEWTYEPGTGDVDVDGDGVITPGTDYLGVFTYALDTNNASNSPERPWFGWRSPDRDLMFFDSWFRDWMGTYDPGAPTFHTIAPRAIQRIYFATDSNSPYRQADVIEYTFGYNRDRPVNPQTGLPWDATTPDVDVAYTPLPSAVRITLTLHDKQAKLSAGREFQFVIRLPRRGG